MMTIKRSNMKPTYTLIDAKGNVMQFFTKATAELYQTIKGGVVLTDAILETIEFTIEA